MNKKYKNSLKVNGVRNILNFTGILPEHLEKKREDFVPEIEPKLIPYNEKIWKKMFPVKKDLDYKMLQLSNIGIYSIF